MRFLDSGVWRTKEQSPDGLTRSPIVQRVPRSNEGWRREFEHTLPDLREDDIAGSGFAISSYIVNHMAPDHPWVDEHPGHFIHGSEADLIRSPQNYCRVATMHGPRLFAYGRDPYFDGWPDTLQRQGFDCTYDKCLYDRLREQHARPVREHFGAGMEFQAKCARFLENHDEPRAAVMFAPEVLSAAAVLTYLSPGLRFFHDGQFEGRKMRISPHLVRRPDEPTDNERAHCYEQLLAVLRRPIVRDGRWSALECIPAWNGNDTSDNFIAFGWERNSQALLCVVNYSPQQGQCFVCMPFAGLAGRAVRVQGGLSL